jgi:hypothetical protein
MSSPTLRIHHSLRQYEALRAENADLIAQRKQEAREMRELLKEQVARKVESERAADGELTDHYAADLLSSNSFRAHHIGGNIWR